MNVIQTRASLGARTVHIEVEGRKCKQEIKKKSGKYFS